ncbi:MAG: hypothetical protein FJ284_07020 [Planctomycetes bacterium]|nr:hypothetical protein [Planctomycetota bacterium]
MPLRVSPSRVAASRRYPPASAAGAAPSEAITSRPSTSTSPYGGGTSRIRTGTSADAASRR